MKSFFAGVSEAFGCLRFNVIMVEGVTVTDTGEANNDKYQLVCLIPGYPCWKESHLVSIGIWQAIMLTEDQGGFGEVYLTRDLSGVKQEVN